MGLRDTLAQVAWAVIHRAVFGSRRGWIRWDEAAENRSRAVSGGIDAFFRRRMQNKLKKVNGHNWLIAHIDDQDVLYGYPEQDGWEELVVETLYRVDRGELDTRFPAWRTADGVAVQRIVARETRSRFPGRTGLTWSAELVDGQVRVRAEVLVEENASVRREVFELQPFSEAGSAD